MNDFVLIAGILLLLFPQASCLKCNVCKTRGTTCVGEEETCSANFTRCGTVRLVSYFGETKENEELRGSCFPEEGCRPGSMALGPVRMFYTTKCCDTDNCNTELPPPPSIERKPNGVKCDVCVEQWDGSISCDWTMDCVGDQTYCTSAVNPNVMGCATRSFCVDGPFFLEDLKDMTCTSSSPGSTPSSSPSSSPGAGPAPLCTLLLSLVPLLFYK